MIKKIILAVLLALPTFCFAQGKFGVVDTDAIIQALPETATAQQSLLDVVKKYEDQLQGLQKEYNTKVEAFKALPADELASVRQLREEEILKMQETIQTFQANAQKDIQQKREAALAPIVQKVQQAIQAVGQEGGFTFIFEKMMPSFTGADVVDIDPLVKAKLGIK